MPNRIVVALLAAAPLLASAADYTYTGLGADVGVWTDPDNWSPNTGYPKGGDFAIFETAATFTSDFSFGTGDLTVSNDVAATLTFDCSISGEGGFNKRGGGAIHLKRSNPFTGDFTSLGIKDCPWGKKPGQSSEVHVYDGGAMGTSYAHLDCDDKPHGSRLTIHGGLTFDIPIRLSNDGAQEGSAYYDAAGSEVRFKKPVSTPMRYTNIGSAAKIVFEDSLTCSYFNPGGALRHEFYGLLTVSSTAYTVGNQQFYFGDVTNRICSFSSSAGVSVHCLGNTFFAGYGSGQTVTFSSGNWYHLYGHGITLTNLNAFGQPSSLTTSNYGFTTPVDSPAVVTLAAKASTANFHGQFSGAAGLRWAPTGNYRFVFDTTMQTTIGSLEIEKGTVVVTNGAGFANLSALAIGENGAFDMASDAGGFYCRHLTVATGTSPSVHVGTDKSVRCSTAEVNGNALEPGTYDKTTLPEVVCGDGSLVVGATPVNTWVATAAGDWNVADNWSFGVPRDGDAVVVPSSADVTITNSTPALSSFSIADGGTVRLAGWDTKLTAELVEISGTLTTTGGAFRTADDAPASRVWIACSNLTIAAMGAIDVQGKGWAGGVSGVAGRYGVKAGGFGPGASIASVFGAGHGGVGGAGDVSADYDDSGSITCGRFGYAYDDPYAPTLPGSGAHSGTSGGGAVRIEATGTVAVNGAIRASAALSTADNNKGSGGSVWISCGTFAGSGEVLAEGGAACSGAWPVFLVAYLGETVRGTTRSGGGGMVRIECNGIGSLGGMKISAAPGYAFGNGGVGVLTAVDYDKYRVNADLGTLTFNNNLILDALLGKGLSGRLVGVTNYTYSADMEWTWGHVRFAGEGANVAFGGDVTISGKDSRLEIGGTETKFRRTISQDFYAGTKLNSCTIAGDLVLDGGGFDIRAAETNATMAWGGEVAVGGDLTVKEGGRLVPWCDLRNLGAPHFTVGGAFTVEVGGAVVADYRGAGNVGASGRYNATTRTGTLQRGWLCTGSGLGIGPGGNTNRGASHGGAGGGSYMEKDGEGSMVGAGCKVILPDEWTAAFPGSGGGASGYGAGGAGGGLVYVEANGPLVVDGRVSADGWMGDYSFPGRVDGKSFDLYAQFGSGAGGGIHLKGLSFSGSGVLSACGGNSASLLRTVTKEALAGSTLGYAGGAGGGGRIVVITNADPTLPADIKKEIRGDDSLVTFSGLTLANGGTNVWHEVGHSDAPVQFPLTHGGAGTVRFVNYVQKSGLMILLK